MAKKPQSRPTALTRPPDHYQGQALDPAERFRLQAAVFLSCQRLQSSEQASLRRAFVVWLRNVLLPTRLPGVPIDAVLELSEVRNMLAERVIE